MSFEEGTFAAIDLGSNSIHMAVYRMGAREMALVERQKDMAGIIGYVRDGRMGPEGIQRAAKSVAALTRKAAGMGAQAFCFATASLRGVKNQKEVLDAIRGEAGIDVDIVTWEREAYYDYLAVERLMGVRDALAIDIGGGSIEMVWIRKGKLHRNAGIPTGSLRLCHDYVRGMRPEPEEMARIEAAMNGYMDEIGWIDNTGFDTLCSVGGTARAVAKVHKAIIPAPLQPAEHYTYPISDLDALLNVVTDKDRYYEIVMRICPDRIHTLAPGFIALRTIAKRAGVSRIVLSPFGVREGYLIEKVWGGGAV